MFRPLVGDTVAEERWITWRDAARRAVRERSGDDVVLFVVDHPEARGQLVACGAGIVARRLPNPHHPDGLAGYVQWMSTEPAFQRRGLARAVLRAVIDWFAARGIDNVELHATEAGEPLYRSEGFWRGSGGLPLRRRPWDPPPRR